MPLSREVASLGRYRFPDPYTLKEFERAYEGSDAKGRIRLLHMLCSSDDAEDWGIPEEIASLAVEDDHSEVRQWIARHGKWLEDSLVERLRRDPDPFVRACVRENETLFRFLAKWEREFADSAHLERLALLRNPSAGGMPEELLERIFDPDDRDLGIGQAERKQLILAFLTNARALNEKDPLTGPPDHSRLWTAISKWPAGSKEERQLKCLVYRLVKADDKTYRACPDPSVRAAILEACGDWDWRTVALGLSDPDESCYSAARGKKKGRWERRLGLTGGYEEKALPRDISSVDGDFLTLQKRLARIEAQIRATQRSLRVLLTWVLFVGLPAWFVISQWTWTLWAGIAAIPIAAIWLLAFLWARCREYQRYVSLGGTRGFLSYWPWRFDRGRKWGEMESWMETYRERDDE